MDTASLFRYCDQAAPAFIAGCYKGIGVAFLGLADRDPVQTNGLCATANSPYRLWCWDGALESLLGSESTMSDAVELCRQAPVEITTFCFESLGETLPETTSDPARWASLCQLAEDAAWISTCRSNAGLAV
jgi:hypothetical protein